MNEFARWRRLAERNKLLYPPGTRIELGHMNDPYDPVPSGTKGTVVIVDDAGQLHMKWDNGRTLALDTDEDSFRTLSEAEIAEEQRLAEQHAQDGQMM